MIVFARLSTAVSLLFLAAHFLREGNPLLLAVCLASIALLGVRRLWARATLQIALALGTLEWLRVLALRVGERQARGGEFMRLAVILGVVAALCAAAAWALGTARVRAGFRSPPS